MERSALLIAAAVAYFGFLGYICWRYGLWPFGEAPEFDDGPDVVPAEWSFPKKWTPPPAEFVVDKKELSK